MKKLILAVVITLLSSTGSATNAWYWGEVTQVMTFTDDGSFFVTIDNGDIATNCNYSRIRFTVTDMGSERTKAALSMALTALTAGKQFGVVVDLDQTTSSNCYASSTSSQGAAIK
ncbi:hypothetical protein [Kangiella geojedonensis]|uniref:Uncharacterized protein n=1 Tax=Kangiella geojedonensis TaxID=914150 RepID=A0A0F6TPJ4_9GAMM|nr:hypothetical protein [Kangiella geojedonensis]AKE51277.1 hypothetical protein TQ33_0289 [Kangiella geojedonensis]